MSDEPEDDEHGTRIGCVLALKIVELCDAVHRELDGQLHGFDVWHALAHVAAWTLLQQDGGTPEFATDADRLDELVTQTKVMVARMRELERERIAEQATEAGWPKPPVTLQ